MPVASGAARRVAGGSGNERGLWRSMGWWLQAAGCIASVGDAGRRRWWVLCCCCCSELGGGTDSSGDGGVGVGGGEVGGAEGGV